MTLLKELIDIPDRVQRGDFVLRLAEDIQRPDAVLENYVVTPELRGCYDAALSFIGNAVQNRSSKATYLHGSFGSGKSHFMAVLHLILQGNPAARSIPELAPVIRKHNDWLAGKKFLLVPYHMIGAHDMESGILGNYVEFMRRTHPDAPTPPVYVSAAIIEQARGERSNYGDEAFFRRLNAGVSPGGSGGWGELEAAWDGESFDRAAAAAPDSEEHLRLVSTLLKTVASAQAEVVSHRGGNFVRFDKGLSLISRHAKEQGYDALILFLDELILWLATNSADLSFVKREAGKLTNLVEAQSVDRPIPLVSFVARQRDLRELVGDHVPGADKLSFSDSLDYQQGRFDTITLEDRNLPAIAEKRVLKCRNSAAREELDAAFEKTAKMRESVMNILLTHEGNREMFRRVYPFSPALVQTLIAVSSVLQRERTALKVMLQLLVDHRETLQVGDVIPVGDLFDVVAHGDEAFSPDMAIHFDNAKRLYHQRLLPELEKQHGVRREDVEQLPFDDSKRTAFRNDDRLIKTLLLSALVPEVESLRGLTAEKLAALNHGTIRSPIPGQERTLVLNKCRAWAAAVGEIRIGEETNPTVSVQLSGVDTESIIEQARREDNEGNRIRRVRQMLFDQLGVKGEGEFEPYHEFWWRNTKRLCKVLFRNIRELPDSSLENQEADWKLVIDYPFDEVGRGPRDDLSVIQRCLHAHPEGAKTLCWVPSFFSREAQQDLGTLVILEHILTGERFGQYSNHLSPQDRQAAKSVLESQRSQLKQRVQNHLDAAYGLDAISSGSLDTTHDLDASDHYVSMWPGFDCRPPVAANLAGAMQHLLNQALMHEFPAAPEFEAEIKPGNLKKVYEIVLPAVQTSDGRLAVESSQRALLRQIANPLKLGEMGTDATYFVLGSYWKNHFQVKAAQSGGTITVGMLRKWLDEPKPMGLPKEAQNIVILLFAAQTNRSFFRHGGPYDDATPGGLPDDCELRTANLPEAAVWGKALERAASIFGVVGSRLASLGNISQLGVDVKKQAADARRACQSYGKRLADRLAQFGISADQADRLKTAVAVQGLLDKLCAAEASSVVGLLAATPVATSADAMGVIVKKAAELEGNLDTAGWTTFELVGRLPGEHQATASGILADVKAALCSDELAMPLAGSLKDAHARALRLLEKLVEKKPTAVPEPERSPSAPPKTIPSPELVPRRRIVEQGDKSELSLTDAISELEQLRTKLKPGRSARVNLSWIVEEGGST